MLLWHTADLIMGMADFEVNFSVFTKFLYYEKPMCISVKISPFSLSQSNDISISIETEYRHKGRAL